MTQIKHAINEEYKSEVFLMDCMEEIKLAKELNIPIKAMSKETKILFKPK